MIMKKIEGVMPALVTPLCADESINVPVLKQLIGELTKKGAQGFYIGGATGEGLALRTSERMVLADESVKAIRELSPELPAIVQVASMDFSDALRLAKQAEDIGADMISATAPLFFAYDEDDVYAYYKRIAEAVHIPMMVYYNPAVKFNMSAEFAKRLFEIDNVTAIKWTSSDYYGMLRVKELTNGDMCVMNGFDQMLLMGLSGGADGGIGTTYNYQLEYIRGIYDSFGQGDMKRALEFQTRASDVVAAFGGEPIIPASKALLECMGYAVGNAAFPMKRYSEDEKRAIYSRLKPLLP